MIHEPAKWAGWQSTTAAAQHLDRLKQMQAQIYQILRATDPGEPLQKIIRDTKRTDFYLDARKGALDYGFDRRNSRQGRTEGVIPGGPPRQAASRAFRNSSSSRGTFAETECRVGAQPSARARGLRTI